MWQLVEAAPKRRILVTGATGYIGGRLVPALVSAGNDVRCLVRDPGRIAGRFEGIEVVRGDVFDPASLRTGLRDCDVAYYLVHSMSDDRRDFSRRDREAARQFGMAAAEAGVARIIFLGGLGNDSRRALSPHLRSRHQVGEELGAGNVPVTEFRAAIIVGSGSVSFEMVRYLTERLPVMIAPKWVRTRCQPIGVRDVIAYLVAALDRPASIGRIVEIGGADVLQYREMMLRYAAIRGLVRRIFIVPFFSPGLSSRWIHLVTPIPASIAQPLVEGLFNEVIVRDEAARALFPEIVPLGYDEAVLRALDRNASSGPETTWFDAYDVKTLPGEFAGSAQGMFVDRRERQSTAPPHEVFRVFTSLGGAKGWLYADHLWDLRGAIDRLAGGVGMRRGRRSPHALRVGDAVDFWRVEAYRPDQLLRLRAEMKLPGYAWLEFEAVPRDGGGTTLRQTAFFDPRGIFGFLYWYSVLPFHECIFGNMATRIVREAEAPQRAAALPAQ
ncbi:MAG: SDR family oxidoreductase [Candidatus Velthaea sp.]